MAAPAQTDTVRSDAMRRYPSVGVICHFPPPPGGMSVQAEALFTCLRSEGFEVVRIPTNLRGGPLTSRLDSIPVIRTLFRLPAFLLRLAAALPTLDILHVNGCSGLSFFLFSATSILFGRLLNRKVILHYHGGGARRFLQRTAPLTPWIIRRASSVIVPSQYLREVFAEWRVAAETIPNICDLRRFLPPQPPATPVFLVARSLEPIYDIETAIRAFASFARQYPNAELRVAGDGSQRQMLRGLALHLGVAERVTFLGSVDNTLIPEVLREASAFINTSLVDNQPVSIIEAFAAGVPVISSDVGGVPDLITHRVNGLLFKPRDVNALVEHMIHVTEDSSAARTFAAHARATADTFSWPEVFRQLRRVYSGTAHTDQTKQGAAS